MKKIAIYLPDTSLKSRGSMAEYLRFLNYTFRDMEITNITPTLSKHTVLRKIWHLMFTLFGSIIFKVWRYDYVVFISQEFIFINFFRNQNIIIIHDLTQLYFPRNIWGRFIILLNLNIIKLRKKYLKIITPSTETCLLLDNHQIQSTVIPNPFDINNLMKFRTRITKNYYVWVGSRDKHKRPDLLHKIREAVYPNKLIIIGDPVLQNIAGGAEIPTKDYNLIVSQSKGVIITSQMEGFCRPAYEAWIMGVPIFIPNDLNIEFPFIVKRYSLEKLRQCQLTYQTVEIKNVKPIEFYDQKNIRKKFLELI